MFNQQLNLQLIFNSVCSMQVAYLYTTHSSCNNKLMN